VGLLRLSPVVPYSLLNYLLGITSIGFWSSLVTSWIAMLPGTFLYVYLGYLGKAGLTAAHGTVQWVLLILGLTATIVVTVYLARLAVRALREAAGIPVGSNSRVSSMHVSPWRRL